MDGNKQISVMFIGNFGSFLQINGGVIFSGKDDAHIGNAFFNVFSNLQSYRKRHILFFGVDPGSSRVFTSMTRIDHDFCNLEISKPNGMERNQNQED